MDKAKDVGVEESFLFTPLAALRARTPGWSGLLNAWDRNQRVRHRM